MNDDELVYRAHFEYKKFMDNGVVMRHPGDNELGVFDTDEKHVGLPPFPTEGVQKWYLPVFPNLNPKAWKYKTTRGNDRLLESMGEDHLVTAMRMIWNNFFVKKFRDCTPVEEGKDFRNELLDRSLESQIITLNMLVWEWLNNRKMLHGCYRQSLFDQVKDRMKQVGMLHSSLGGYAGRLVTPVYPFRVTRGQKVILERLTDIGVVMRHPVDEVDKETDLVENSIEISKEFFMSKKIFVVRLAVEGDGTTYRLTNDTELKVDDLVVFEEANFFMVGKVIEVDVNLPNPPKKWVVGKVDLTALEKIKADIAEAAKIRKELDQKLETQRSRVIYESLAKDDPEAAAALARLAELEG